MTPQKYFRIKAWETMQHYKKRNPPWIKLHRELLIDYRFQSLGDITKLHFLLLSVLASQLENRLPFDEKWLTGQLGLKQKIDLQPLLDAEFIECYQDASKVLATCKQSAIPETETYTELYPEAEGDSKLLQRDASKASNRAPCLRKIWNDHRGNMPAASKMTEKRKRAWRSLWRQEPDEAYWVKTVQKMAESEFLAGQNDRNWAATIDFLLRPDTHVKVHENRYKDSRPSSSNLGGLEIRTSMKS